MPALEAARTMVLPAGFECRLFAAEPDVQQPIAMAWDARGRLWVAECYTYAETPLRWDTNLRDRILIFEDTDNDGRFDKRTVFWDESVRLTSIALAKDGVYALCAPDLLFLPDRNGDDIPDGPPQTVLDGFNFQSIGHNIANGLRWGPDGWLYGRHGILETSAIGVPGTPDAERQRLNCGIFRFHPATRAVEVFCHGGTNAWGMDWDRQGELFWTNTVIGHLWHGLRGAYYERMFGAHLNPHVYEAIQQTADHYHFDIGSEKWSDLRNKPMSARTDALGGGHAHVGCLIYEGGQWPEQYRGNLFTLNLHGHRMNRDLLEREGCGFVAKHAEDFLHSRDPWFRGIDLSTGPDGSVFILDWSDAGECHDNDGVHRTSGRIFKISYGTPGVLPPFDLSKLSDTALDQAVAAHADNLWWARTADRVRAQRTLLSAHGSARATGTLAKPRPLNTAAGAPSIADAQNADGLKRLHLASALQQLPLRERFPIARALASRSEDASDRQQSLMVWYGIEPAVVAFPEESVALAVESCFPKLTRFIARRLTEELEASPEPVDALLSAALKHPHTCGEIAAGMAAALKGIRRAPKPAHWDSFAKLLANGNAENARELALVFGDGRVVEDLLKLVKDTSAETGTRLRALESVLASGDPVHFELLKSLLNDRFLGTAARMGCARFPKAEVPQVLLAKWPAKPEWREANLHTLCSRPEWAAALLDSIEKNPETRKDLTPIHARQIRTLGVEALSGRLAEVWGEVRDSPEAKKQEMAKWKMLLNPEALASADPQRGKALFATTCGTCHKLQGEGGSIGPDLTGSDRRNLAYLLENLLDPSAVVPADYRLRVIQLKDGRTLAGVVPEQSDRTLTVQTPVERLHLPKSDILKIEQLQQSLMPEGLLEALGEENARHLIAYLMR